LRLLIEARKEMKKILVFGALLALTFYGFTQDYPDSFYNGEKYILKSNILEKEADVFIYLPNDYYTDTLRTYPVHYVTDAPSVSNLYFDLMRFRMSTGEIPQCIVVGLSGDDRNQNLYPGLGAEKYISYLESEVIPFIDDTYRTTSYKVLAGHSLAGNFVTYTMLKQPSLFTAYVAGSPGPPELMIDLLKNTESEADKDMPFRFFFSSIGSKDLTGEDLFQEIEQLLKQIYTEHDQMFFEVNENEDHISNISVNIQHALDKLYRGWLFTLPEDLAITRPADELLKDYIAEVQEKYGEDVYLGEYEVFYPVIDRLGEKKEFSRAIGALHLLLKFHPNSDEAYAYLAHAHLEINKPEKALEYVNKALELNPRNKKARAIRSMLATQ
jgi:uncharacterized protein